MRPQWGLESGVVLIGCRQERRVGVGASQRTGRVCPSGITYKAVKSPEQIPHPCSHFGCLGLLDVTFKNPAPHSVFKCKFRTNGNKQSCGARSREGPDTRWGNTGLGKTGRCALPPPAGAPSFPRLLKGRRAVKGAVWVPPSLRYSAPVQVQLAHRLCQRHVDNENNIETYRKSESALSGKI